MGKKTRFLFAVVWLLALWMSRPLSVYAGDEDINVVVNGRPVHFGEVGPRYANARVMVPVAPFCEALGARVVWNPASQDVFIYLFDRYVWLQSTNMTLYYGTYAIATDGSGAVYLTGVTPMPLTLRPDLAEGRLVAPLGSLVAALGGTVTWDGETETVFVTKPPYAPARYYENVPLSVAADSESDGCAPPGYFRLITPDDVRAKYEAVEPFILICYHSAQTDALREAQQAAADGQTVVYGLDRDEYGDTLPFMTQQGRRQKDTTQGVTVYFLTGDGRVTVLTAPDYEAMAAGIRDYWAGD